jgi:hypothetical protein
MTESNALHSLYGGKDARNALAGHVGGQSRTQEVWTPGDILAAVADAFGGPIRWDPCAATDPSVRFAEVNATLSEEGQKLESLLPFADKAQTKALKKLIKPHYLAGSLAREWPPGDTFVNPPYGTGFLERWIRRCFVEAQAGRRIVGLWPVRTHRKWWVRDTAGAEIVFLNYKVVFRGHKNAFPAPLCLTCWNVQLGPLGSKETGRWDRQS